jgi:hypothetical protein
MTGIPNELLYQNRIIWWDPGPDGPYGPNLPHHVLQQLAAITLEARAQTLKVQSDAYSKIAGIVAATKAAGGQG